MSTHPAVKNGAYDVARVRQDFPALAMQVYGKPLVYLDNAASAQKPQAVLDRLTQAYTSEYANVHQIAQQTDGKMMSRALLLSDDAEIDNKPELEIFADDVQCGHGATVGALDDSLLFYLRARGLPEKEAQALLIQAFVGEALESIVNDDLRDVAIGAAERWLGTRA